MYLYDKNRITYFAETDRRNKRVPFGIKAEDRTRHMYIIGKTGMGKSTLIENLVVQDIKNGEGVAFIDPHGKSAALLLDYIPPERVKDVVYFAPFDSDNPISFNVMEDVGPDKRHLVANGLMSAFKKIFGAESFSDRMQYILMNCLLALLEYPDSTLLGVNRMLTDKAYRKKVVDNVKDPSVKAYWVEEFAKYTEKFAAEATPAVQNKLGQFTSNPLIRNIIGQPHSSFDLRKMMDERKILIVNLSKGQLGEGNAALLGGMIITKIYLAAMSRADLTEEQLKRLPNFYMYVDEFQNFANESFADILSEARKYKLALTVAHQYIKQMDEKVADAVFGNVGTQIMFRVGAPDAEELEKEYAPVFTAEDMVSLGFTQIYLKLMIDGVASHPFSAVTLGPIALPAKSLREEVIKSSREIYGRPRPDVEKSIADWFVEGLPVQAPKEAPRAPAEPSRDNLAPREPYKPATPSTQGVPSVTISRPSYQPQDSRPRSVSESAPRPSSSLKIEHASVPEVRPSTVPFVQKTADPQKPAVQPSSAAPVQREPLRTQRTEKPFALALKDIVIPEPVKKEEVKPISLSSLPPVRPGNGAISSVKTKGPTQEGLSGLKAALAEVTRKPSTVTAPQSQPASVPKFSQNTQFPRNQQQSRPFQQVPQNKVDQNRAEKAPELAPRQSESIEKKPEFIPKQNEQKEVPQAPAATIAPSSSPTPAPEITYKKEEPAKPREVPEDVLMAILRGDD